MIWNCRSYSKKDFQKCESGIVATAHYLLEHGADCNSSGQVPLYYAVSNKSIPLVMLLRAKGAKVTDDILSLAPIGDIKAALSSQLKFTPAVVSTDEEKEEATLNEKDVDLDGGHKRAQKEKKERDMHNPMLPDVMISLCCRTQQNLAYQLRDYLHSQNLSTFLCMDMGAGDIYRSEIIVAAASSKFFIPLIDTAWANSKECAFETNIALRNSLVQGRPTITPIVPDSSQFESLNATPYVMGIFCNSNAEFIEDLLHPVHSFERIVHSMKTANQKSDQNSESIGTVPAPASASVSTDHTARTSRELTSGNINSDITVGLEKRMSNIESAILSLHEKMDLTVNAVQRIDNIEKKLSTLEEKVSLVLTKM